MGYIPGKNIMVFITTENSAAGVVLTGTAPAATTASTGMGSGTLGVGKLGSLTASTDVSQKITNVEGLDVARTWEDDAFTPYGQGKEVTVPVRKKFDMTITRKSPGNGAFAKLFEGGGRHGPRDTSSMEDGTNELASTSGYRIYVYKNGTWDVYYHAFISPDGFTETYDPLKVIIESVKFTGNLWSASVLTASLITGCALE